MTAPLSDQLAASAQDRWTGHVLTSSVWGAIVERWNDLSPQERAEAAAICRQRGHQWRETTVRAQLCVRCCKWEGAE